MVVIDLDLGAGLGYRELLQLRRLGRTPGWLALPAFALLSVANAADFPITRQVLATYAAQLRALFRANEPAYAHLRASLADLTSVGLLRQSDVRTPVPLRPCFCTALLKRRPRLRPRIWVCA